MSLPDMRILFRTLLLIGIAALGWRIVAVNLSNQYADSIQSGNTEAARKAVGEALNWEPQHPQALYSAALDRIPGDLDGAAGQLAEAYRQNPTDPRPLLVLAGLELAQGADAQADDLVRLAGALRPVDSSVQRDVAAYWFDRRQFALALDHWSAALSADSNLRAQRRFTQPIFDRFREILEHADGVAAFRDVTNTPPVWWHGFFADTAKRASDIEVLGLIYGMRRQSIDSPLTTAEREIYINRLLKDKRYADAYLAWVNSLTAEQRKHLGPLHNGSFELPLSNQAFGWHLNANDLVDVTLTSFDHSDSNALRLVFRVSRDPYNHLYQTLFLAAGPYEVNGAFRSIEFFTDGGVRWVVRCISPETRILAESERIFGAEDWTRFSFQFEVPQSCNLQEIRLISSGGPAVDQPIDGEIWFDDLTIQRINALTPLASARSDILGRAPSERAPDADAAGSRSRSSRPGPADR